MLKKVILIFVVVLALVIGLMACSKAPEQKGAKDDVKVGQVKLNPHPASLEGKTVVLRWNGKFNGDKVLDRVAELLTENVPGVKIVKMYRVDPSTAVVSETMEKSLQITDKIVALKPDIVIASQAD
jgi:ABC-type Fe3+-hydroxamate transport system substrate-binding protein